MPEPIAWLRRLLGTFRTSAFERAMAEEFEQHITLETEALIARGMDAESARLEARRRFGSIACTEDACRDSWGLRALDALLRDTRYAARLLTKSPGYTAIVVLTLALGIGANTAIFSLVHAVLLRALPYASGESMIEIRQRAAGADNLLVSAREIADYRRLAASLDEVVEYHQMWFNLLGGAGHDQPSRVMTGVVSAPFFDVVGVRPLLGRTFTADDDRADAPPVLLVSYAYWQRALGGDPHVIGRTFEMNDKVHTVVGVLPKVPLFPEENDVYMPVSACPFRSSPVMEGDRRARMMSAFGRVKAGLSLSQARAELDMLGRRFAESFPSAYDSGFAATALSVREQLSGRARAMLLALLATSGLVLLVACANVANLMLARVAGRERELALRSALGAGRGRIARQLLAESLLLALAGGVAGLALAAYARDLLVGLTLPLSPRAGEVAIDRAVLLFTFATSIATGLVFGVVPALRVGATASRPAAATRHALITVQVALSFVLLTAAGLTTRSFLNLRSVDGGFRADRVLTAHIDLDWVRYDTADKRRDYFRPLLERLAAEPGVVSAALSLTFPLNESAPFSASFRIKDSPSGQRPPQADFRLASPEYFSTVGMTIVKGRAFTAGDHARARPVAIVNLAMARHAFGGSDPVGRRVSFDNGKHWTTIVGVVNDVRQYGLAAPPADELYMPFDQRAPLSASVLVRAGGDPMATLGTLRRIARAIDARQPISNVQTLSQVRAESLAPSRLTASLVGLLAALALAITAVGIAGVVSFAVSRRTAEIGVRVMLGARRGAVIAMVARQGLAPVALGLAIGAAASLAATQALARTLYEVRPIDPLTYAGVIVVLTLSSAIACLVPARRAATIDPLQAIRTE